jgi:putative hydrolase of the HAD superfamily
LKYDKSCATVPEALRATFTTLQQTLPKDFESYCRGRIKRYLSYLEMLPNAKELLETLEAKNVPLALITNGTLDVQTAAIYKVDIQNYFKTILISGELGVRKPDARIFHLACERLGISPEDCLMVGDKLDADIEGAKTIGMQTAWMSEQRVEGLNSFPDLYSFQTWLEPHLE